MRHHRRHPLIDRVRRMLTERPRRPPSIELYTDQMPFAPPYRGPDTGRGPGVYDRADESSTSAEPPMSD